MDQEPVCSTYNENGPGRVLVAQVSIIILEECIPIVSDT